MHTRATARIVFVLSVLFLVALEYARAPAVHQAAVHPPAVYPTVHPPGAGAAQLRGESSAVRSAHPAANPAPSAATLARRGEAND